MGQYYRPVITKAGKTTICGNATTNKLTKEHCEWHGLKIMEHAWWGNHLSDGMAQKIYKRKGRIAWVGDYSDEGVFTSFDGTQTPLGLEQLYGKELAEDNIQLQNTVIYNGTFTLRDKFIVNLSRKEYLDCNKYFKGSVTSDGWCVHPLPLLTSTGGDRGGGDYHREYINADMVGRWAYDELIIRDKAPSKDYSELAIIFSEEIYAEPVVGII